MADVNANNESSAKSCIEGISREDFIKKILLKGAAAGTLAVLMEAAPVRVRSHSASAASVSAG